MCASVPAYFGEHKKVVQRLTGKLEIKHRQRNPNLRWNRQAVLGKREIRYSIYLEAQ